MRQIFGGREFFFGLKNNRSGDINPILSELGLSGSYHLEVELYDGEPGDLIDEADLYFDYSAFDVDDVDEWWREYHATGREWLEKFFGNESYPASFEILRVWKL